MPRTLLPAAVAALALLSPLAVAADPAPPAPAAARAEPVDPKALKIFSQVLNRVREQYVEEISDEKLIEAAVSGMLTALDPHSGYLDAGDYTDLRERTSGQFGGLGIEISMENGALKVVSPLDDSPAARAGLLSGDMIVDIAGEPVKGLTLREASERLRGPIGSEITLRVRRGDAAAFPISIKRDLVRSRSVRFETEGSVGYIRIASFNQQTQPGLEAAMLQIDARLGDRLAGYVLDLRNNPGGLLRQAVSVADSFLDSGTIVSTKGRGGRELERFTAKPGDLAHGRPVVVLINTGSASASEIVAGALQDNRRAVVMGTQSFGKGSVQTIMPLRNSTSAIKLTTARYYTPSGRSIQAIGINPDIEVVQARIETFEERSLRREADLRGALRNDTAGAGAAAVPPPPLPAVPAAAASSGDDRPFDYQRQRAVDLLTGMAAFGGPAAAPVPHQAAAALP